MINIKWSYMFLVVLFFLFQIVGMWFLRNVPLDF